MSEGNNASEEPPKSSNCKKRKVDERENAIDHTILEKIHYINEGEPVTEIDYESPAEIRDTADKPKPEKARKRASVANFIPVIPREMEDVVSLDKVKKFSMCMIWESVNC